MQTPLPPQFSVVGHAIVSADGMIADRNGEIPPALRVPADWDAFQAALDASALVVLGRKGHARHPNPGRKRLVLTGSVEGMVRDTADRYSHFWNPATLPLSEVLKTLEIAGGTLAVTGGQGVFDYFAPLLTAFELVECPDFAIPGGIACFSKALPHDMLLEHGLKPGPARIIDPARGITASRWVRSL